MLNIYRRNFLAKNLQRYAPLYVFIYIFSFNDDRDILKIIKKEETLNVTKNETPENQNDDKRNKFQGIRVSWKLGQNEEKINNFHVYILTRDAPGDWRFSENLILYHYLNLINTNSDAVVVGIGTGQTSDSWFSFELGTNTNRFIKELKTKTNIKYSDKSNNSTTRTRLSNTTKKLTGTVFEILTLTI
jgi:hypothetical protein